MIKKWVSELNNHYSSHLLLKVLLCLLIFYLTTLTYSVWGSWLSTFWKIVTPMLWGIALAFIMEPLIKCLENKGITRKITVFLLWIVIIVVVVLFLIVLIPMIYDKIIDFINSFKDGINWIFNKITEMGGEDLDRFAILETLEDSMMTALNEFKSWIPQITSEVPNILATFLDILTNTLFSVIIAIYISLDYDKFKKNVRKFVKKLFPRTLPYVSRIDDDIAVYVKSVCILIGIQIVEYGLFYYLVGHPDWLILGFLTAFATLIPYIGGTLANIVGILTGLSLSTLQVFIMCCAMLILPNVDAYIVSPMVHKKRSSLGALTSLMAVFAGGVIAGILGIILSIPVAIAIKSGLEVYREQHEDIELPIELDNA